jgi:hypothetical protein
MIVPESAGYLEISTASLYETLYCLRYQKGISIAEQIIEKAWIEELIYLYIFYIIICIFPNPLFWD